MKFRPLRSDEIEVRVGSVSQKGASLLLYKDARCDMNILDETVGELNWQSHYLRDNANCIVSIWDKTKEEWIEKEDTGTESYTEKEKGLASDSFKRACFKWGIGRELYTAPFIFVACQTVPNGKVYKLASPFQFSGVRVSHIEYSELESRRVISELELVDKKGNSIYSWKATNQPKAKLTSTPKPTDLIGEGGVDYISNLAREKKADIEELFKFYKISSFEEMTVEQFNACREILERRP
jgi:hypothetical protein